MSKPLIVLVLLAGCARPGAPDSAAEGLVLRPVMGSEGAWDLEVLNQGDELAEISTSIGTDALQLDGRWEHLGEDWVYDDDDQFIRSRTVYPGESVLLRSRQWRPLVGGQGPGTFRARVAVLDADEASELILEHTVVGWPSEVAREADALAHRAMEEDCHGLAADIAELTDRRLEPDPLADRHVGSIDPERRGEVLREMLSRGVFVDHLARELEMASMTEVRAVAGQLMRRPADAQRDVRLVAAARLAELFAQPEPLDIVDLHVLERLGDAWPESAAQLAIDRLASGPETGESELELVRLFIYVRDALDEHGAGVREALSSRCEGRDDPDLVAACDSVRDRFAPDRGFWFAGRGWGSGCGWRASSHRPICQDLEERWDALRAREGEPEVVFH